MSPADLLKEVRTNTEIARRFSTYPSFQRGFHTLVQLGWVRLMKKTALAYQRGVVDSGVLAEKHFYALTSEGRAADGWNNPDIVLHPERADPQRTRKYRRVSGLPRGRPRRPRIIVREQPGQELEEQFEEQLVIEAPISRPPIPAFSFKQRLTIDGELVPAITRQNTQALIKHLEYLRDLEPDTEGDLAPEVQQELERLVEDEIQTWLDAVQEDLDEEEGKENPSDDRVDRLSSRVSQLEEAVQEIEGQDFEHAIDALEEMFPAVVRKERVVKQTSPPQPVSEPTTDALALRFESELQELRPAVETLRQPNLVVQAEILAALVDISDRLETAHDRARGARRTALEAIVERVSRALVGWGEMETGLTEGDSAMYLRGWERLRTCCGES